MGTVEDRLVVDLTYRIISEYRGQIPPAGQSARWLNQLETQPRDRLVEVIIQFDANGHAVLPPELEIHDNNDRRFVAVALAHDPTPPIVNATDTDWAQERERLAAGGITMQELCPDFIAERLARER